MASTLVDTILCAVPREAASSPYNISSGPEPTKAFLEFEHANAKASKLHSLLSLPHAQVRLSQGEWFRRPFGNFQFQSVVEFVTCLSLSLLGRTWVWFARLVTFFNCTFCRARECSSGVGVLLFRKHCHYEIGWVGTNNGISRTASCECGCQCQRQCRCQSTRANATMSMPMPMPNLI